MASPGASGESPNAPREQEPLEQHHPEPACREAQKWIEVSEERGAQRPAAIAHRGHKRVI